MKDLFLKLIFFFITLNLYSQPSFFGVKVSFKFYENNKLLSKSKFDKTYRIIDNTWKSNTLKTYEYDEAEKAFTISSTIVYNDYKVAIVRAKDTMQLIFKTSGGVDRTFDIKHLTFKEGIFFISDGNSVSLDLENSKSNYYNHLIQSIDEKTLTVKENALKREVDAYKLKYGIDDDDYNTKNESDLVEISSLKDSTILEKYKRYLKLKNFTDDAESDRMFDGNITYSPDNLFKIFLFKGEYCGAHCEQFYNSFIHFNLDKKSPTVKESYFYPIDSILKMDDKNYLIFHSGYDGGGIYSYNHQVVTLIQFKNNQLVMGKSSVLPVNRSNRNETEIHIQTRYVDNDEGSESTYLKFNRKDNILEYKYFEINEDTGQKRYYYGKLVYKDGIFRWLSKSG